MPQEWRVQNFERGITDNYIDAARNQARTMDNLLIDKNRKIYTRPGSGLFDSSVDADELPGGSRINRMHYFDETLFEFTLRKILYRADEGGSTKYHEFRNGSGLGQTTFLGPANVQDVWKPTSPDPGISFPGNDSSEWQKHLYVTHYDDNFYYRPRKIWKDEDGIYRLRTAGLPNPGDVDKYARISSLYNNLKSKFGNHEAQVAPNPDGHVVNNNTDSSIPISYFGLDQAIDAVIILRDVIMDHVNDGLSGSPTIHHATSSATNQTLSNTSDPKNMTDIVVLLNELREIYYNHVFDAIHGATSGTNLPSISTIDDRPTTVTVSSSSGNDFYIYNLVYKRQYSVGDVVYIDRSSPWEFAVDGPATMGGSEFIALSDMTGLGNTYLGISETFQDGNINPKEEIKLEIYRTEKNGTISKFVGEIEALPGSQFVDRTPDSSLGIDVYTSGGISGADIVPLCKYLTQTNDIMWYANIKEETETRPYRVRQSFQFDPDGCPESYYVDVDDDITGISSVNIFPIVFTKDKTYRLEGFVDQLGRGFTKKRIVDHTIGCVGNSSIVKVKDRIYFAGNDGFYMTDGFRVTKISQHLEESYALMTETVAQRQRIYGVYDQRRELVYWTVTSESTLTENDIIYVHDLHWGYPNNEGTFTTYSAGLNMQASALEVIDGDLIRADYRGYTFRHDDDLSSDLIVDTLVSPSDWDDTAIIYDYTSPAWSFGSEYQRKWVTKLLTTIKPVSNVSVQPQSINDDSQLKKNLKEVRERGVFFWGDPLFTWGDPAFAWRSNPISNFIRRFPRDGLRCFYKQVRYTNAFTVITNSDSGGSVTVDASAKTITLDSGNWPSVQGDLIGGQWIPGSDINGTGYTIISATTTELTVYDPANNLTAGSQGSWYVKQYIETELFYLNGYTIIYDMFGTGHTHYNVGNSGEIGA